jgi:hypothetical protein
MSLLEATGGLLNNSPRVRTINQRDTIDDTHQLRNQPIIVGAANQPIMQLCCNQQQPDCETRRRQQCSGLQFFLKTFYLCQNFVDLQRKPVDSQVSEK